MQHPSRYLSIVPAVSHHDFDDAMTATRDGQAWIFKQTRPDYEIPAAWSVEARRGDDLVWGPLPLTLSTCRQVDTGSNCAETYQ